MENDSYLLTNLDDWNEFLGGIEGAIFVAKAYTNTDGTPKDYPCLVKGTGTIVTDENGLEVPAIFIVFFYTEDATRLLHISAEPLAIEGYQYAQAI